MRTIESLNSNELRKLADARSRFEEAATTFRDSIRQIMADTGNGQSAKPMRTAPKPRRKMSAQARANIAAGVRRRWAKLGYPQK